MQGGLDNMGSSYEYQAPQSQPPSATIAQYSKYLPTIQQETNAGVVPAAQAQTQAAQTVIPQLNALDLQQLQQYAVPMAQVGQQVTNSNALAGAQTNLAQLLGPGGQAATAAANLESQTSPAYAASQKGAAEGVNAINLNGLSPGEAAATERSLNQSNVGTGNLGVLNPQNTIANALNFGGAFNSKIGLLNNATNTATNAANSNQVNPVNIALGQPNTSTLGNFGTSSLQSGTSNTGVPASNASLTTAGGLLSGLTSLNNATTGANAQLGSTSMTTNSPSTYLGDVCCFIFLEAYHGKIPWHVRNARDMYYNINHDIATGYRRMARWLVPLMKQSKTIRALVWGIMIKPITNHTGYCHKKPNYTKARFITHLWLKLWAMLGKGHSESEYSMTWEY